MCRDQRGQTTPFVVITVIALFFAAGLVHDGGHLLAARREVADIASDAARAGAQQISVDALRGGAAISELDGPVAASAARAHLARFGMTGTVTIDGDEVVVRTGRTVQLDLLGFGLLKERDVTATRSARSVRGVDAPET